MEEGGSIFLSVDSSLDLRPTSTTTKKATWIGTKKKSFVRPGYVKQKREGRPLLLSPPLLSPHSIQAQGNNGGGDHPRRIAAALELRRRRSVTLRDP